MLNTLNDIHSQTAVIHTNNHSETAPKMGEKWGFRNINVYLRALKTDIVNRLVDKIIVQIIKHYERSKITKPGVYQYQSNTLDDLSLCSTPTDIKINPKKPVLLFIHGTISSSKHGFSDLWNNTKKDYIKKLLQPYEQQVFFLEHYTISTSPVENALAVAKLFPKGTIFHIISHSRGGIVGELLCQSGLKRRVELSTNKRFIKTNTIFSEQELAPFKEDLTRKADYDGLKELQQLFLDRQFSVERFIRVAAPMRGTAMASASIDEVVSKVFKTLNAIPIPRILGIRSFLQSLAFTFIKKARSVEMMPGIESMMPNSPLIALLNRDSVQLQGELSIIAGQVTNTTSFKQIKKNWLTQNIFKGDHDFVVDTSAAFGGARRVKGASRYYLKKGSNVGHFNYFQHNSILKRIQEALVNPLNILGAFKLLTSSSSNSGSTDASSKDKETEVGILTHIRWRNSALQNKRQKLSFIKIIGFRTKGLVSNILNQLFYVPSSDGWQSLSSGNETLKPYQIMPSSLATFAQAVRLCTPRAGKICLK